MAVKAKLRSKPKKPIRHVGANGVADSAPPEVLTLKEAAALLQVPVEPVRAEAAAGRLPGRNIEGEWRFSRYAILRWLATSDPSPQRRHVDFPIPDETPEEQEAFMERIRGYRDELDQATGSGKYAVP